MRKKVAISKAGKEFLPETEFASTLILDSPVSKTVRNELPLFISHVVHGNLLEQNAMVFFLSIQHVPGPIIFGYDPQGGLYGQIHTGLPQHPGVPRARMCLTQLCSSSQPRAKKGSPGSLLSE